MKKIFIIMSLILFVSFASAEDPFLMVEEEDVVVAGLTPGDFFYNTELAIERFTELFGERIQIAHAKERIAEMKLMIAEGKLNESEIAMDGFDNIYNRIKNKSRIKEHKALKDNLGSRISIIASDGKLTESDRQEIKMLIYQHREKIRNENVEIIAQNNDVNVAEATAIFDAEANKLRRRVTGKVLNRFMEID